MEEVIKPWLRNHNRQMHALNGNIEVSIELVLIVLLLGGLGYFFHHYVKAALASVRTDLQTTVAGAQSALKEELGVAITQLSSELDAARMITMNNVRAERVRLEGIATNLQTGMLQGLQGQREELAKELKENIHEIQNMANGVRNEMANAVKSVTKLTTDGNAIKVEMNHSVLGSSWQGWLRAYVDPTQSYSVINIMCWCACISWLVKYLWNWYKGTDRYESYSQSEKWLKGILDTLTMLAVSVVAINNGWREAAMVFRTCMEWCRMLYTSTNAIKTMRDLFFSDDTSDMLREDGNWFYNCIESAMGWCTSTAPKIEAAKTAHDLLVKNLQGLSDDEESDDEKSPSSEETDLPPQFDGRMDPKMWGERFPLAKRYAEQMYGSPRWRKHVFRFPREQQIKLGEDWTSEVKAEMKKFETLQGELANALPSEINPITGERLPSVFHNTLVDLAKTQWRLFLIALVVIAGVVGAVYLLVNRRKNNLVKEKTKEKPMEGAATEFPDQLVPQPEPVQEVSTTLNLPLVNVQGFVQVNVPVENYVLESVVPEPVEEKQPEALVVITRTEKTEEILIDTEDNVDNFTSARCTDNTEQFGGVQQPTPGTSSPGLYRNTDLRPGAPVFVPVGEVYSVVSELVNKVVQDQPEYEARPTAKKRKPPRNKKVAKRGWLYYDELKKADQFANYSEYREYLREVADRNLENGVVGIPSDEDHVVWADKDDYAAWYSERADDRELEEDEEERKGRRNDDDDPYSRHGRIFGKMSDAQYEENIMMRNMSEEEYAAYVPKYHGRSYDSDSERKDEEGGGFEAVKSRWRCRAPAECGYHGECKNMKDHKNPQSEVVKQAGVVNKSGVKYLTRPMDPHMTNCRFGANCKKGECEFVHPPAICDVTPRCIRVTERKDGTIDKTFQSTSECKRKSCHFYHKPDNVKAPEKQLLKKSGRVHVRNLADRTKLGADLDNKKKHEGRFESLNGGYQFHLDKHLGCTYGLYSKPDPVSLLENATYECTKVTFTKHLGAYENARFLRTPDVNGKPVFHEIDRETLMTTGADLASCELPKTITRPVKNGWREPIPGEICVVLIARQIGDKGEGFHIAYGNVTSRVGEYFGHTAPTVKGDCGSGVWALSDGKLLGWHQLGSGSDKVNGFIPVNAQWAELCTNTIPSKVKHLNS